ncbi:hypothetical protein KHP60_09860 [Microvirga sp. 3-52]|uniref:hypothetical protein n=1 Tax=Microvirga sp. 3-52 TaxID=2792425 RepID=UPI001AC09031|nr:hypothetical protein [Microvirga sp. 3-52]MBO1905270.1 hypothetical protein [Microvirga sp. 3-52]MBS7452640.1 hypothetical protein [Microvirga sp. 3-52]
MIEALKQEFGPADFDMKAVNFKELGPSPFSIVSYHNVFFWQVRSAFIQGLYYPALTSACALGERMLNHLVLSLRDHYKDSSHYRKVYRKSSFDNWDIAIDALADWRVLNEQVASNFRGLKSIRNKSIHFHPETYSTVREDSLSAIKLVSKIIEHQFGFFKVEHEWAISGTIGAQFVSKAYEDDPFIKTFYLPQCPLVGPYYAVAFHEIGILFFDRESYSDHEISDEEFSKLFNERAPEEVVSSDLPLRPGVAPVGVLMRNGKYQLLIRADSATDAS